jgi:hypothetical protein
VLGPSALAHLLLAYLLGAIGVAVLFPRQAHTPAAYWGLLALNVVKAAIMLLDFRLRMNQHYMAFAVSAVFLLVPGKRDALRVLVTLFYFWAGTLKLNREWITGAGLYRPVWLFTGSGVVVACAYVIALELVVSWGLLARRQRIFWGSLAQFAVFHIFSWPVVGFFYPLLMFAILSIFPMCRRWPPPPGVEAAPGLLGSLWTGRARSPTYVTAIGFSLLQLTPYLFPGDSALTGEGRLYALHMFDARPSCKGYVAIRLATGGVSYRDLALPLDTRVACDPVVYYNRARNLCRQASVPGAAIQDLDLYLWSRRATSASFRPIIAVESFCARHITYNPFWHNRWILTD